MKELLQLAWGALLFRDEAYTQHVARADVLKRGLAVLVLVTLLAGVISVLVNFIINNLFKMFIRNCTIAIIRNRTKIMYIATFAHQFRHFYLFL